MSVVLPKYIKGATFAPLSQRTQLSATWQSIAIHSLQRNDIRKLYDLLTNKNIFSIVTSSPFTQVPETFVLLFYFPKYLCDLSFYYCC